MERKLEFFEELASLDVYKVDSLIAMPSLCRIWTEFPRSAIKNFWRYIGLSIDDTYEREQQLDSNPDSHYLKSLIENLIAGRTVVTVQDLHNPLGENCFGNVDNSSLVTKILFDDQESADIDEDEAKAVSLLSYTTQLSALELCKRICDAHALLSDKRKGFSSPQRIVRLERSKEFKQATLDGVGNLNRYTWQLVISLNWDSSVIRTRFVQPCSSNYRTSTVLKKRRHLITLSYVFKFKANKSLRDNKLYLVYENERWKFFRDTPKMCFTPIFAELLSDKGENVWQKFFHTVSVDTIVTVVMIDRAALLCFLSF